MFMQIRDSQTGLDAAAVLQHGGQAPYFINWGLRRLQFNRYTQNYKGERNEKEKFWFFFIIITIF